MKLSNLDLLQSISALSLVGQIHLPVRVSHRIAQVMRQANALNQDYDVARLKLIDQFAAKDDAGKVIETRDPAGGQMVATFKDKAPFDAALKELQAIEVEIPGNGIKTDDLGDVKLPPNVLAALHWLIAD
jgi:hypothetical protein